MTRIELAPGTSDNFERILEPLHRYEGSDATSRLEAILQGISTLKHNPLIVRQVRADTRALIIGRRSRGYVALYRYVPEIDTVFVPTIRSQREAGYQRS